MVLIGECQQLALHAPRLQHIERRQALRDTDPVVFRAVDHELRGLPVRKVRGGVPAVPGGAGRGGEGVRWAGEGRVVPGRSTQVVEGEVELFRRQHVGEAEDAVVADEGAELAAEGVALDPCCYESLINRRSMARALRLKDSGGILQLIMYPP